MWYSITQNEPQLFNRDKKKRTLTAPKCKQIKWPFPEHHVYEGFNEQGRTGLSMRETDWKRRTKSVPTNQPWHYACLKLPQYLVRLSADFLVIGKLLLRIVHRGFPICSNWWLIANLCVSTLFTESKYWQWKIQRRYQNAASSHFTNRFLHSEKNTRMCAVCISIIFCKLLLLWVSNERESFKFSWLKGNEMKNSWATM